MEEVTCGGKERSCCSFEKPVRDNRCYHAKPCCDTEWCDVCGDKKWYDVEQSRNTVHDDNKQHCLARCCDKENHCDTDDCDKEHCSKHCDLDHHLVAQHCSTNQCDTETGNPVLGYERKPDNHLQNDTELYHPEQRFSVDHHGEEECCHLQYCCDQEQCFGSEDCSDREERYGIEQHCCIRQQGGTVHGDTGKYDGPEHDGMEQHDGGEQHIVRGQHDDEQYDFTKRHQQCRIKQQTLTEHYNPEQHSGRELMSDAETCCDIRQCLTTEHQPRTEQHHSDQSGETVLLELNGGYVDVLVDDDDEKCVDNAKISDGDEYAFVNETDHRHVNRENDHGNDKLLQRRKDYHEFVEDVTSNERDFVKGARDDNEKPVSKCKDDHVKGNGHSSSQNESVSKDSRMDMSHSVGQLKDSHSKSQETKLDNTQSEDSLYVYDRDNCVSDSDSDCIDDASQHNETVAGLAKHHSSNPTLGHDACDNSEYANQHDDRIALVCDKCEHPQELSAIREGELSIPTKMFLNGGIHFSDIDNCAESETSEIRTVNNARIYRTTENNSIQNTTNAENASKDEHVDTDSQNCSLNTKTQLVSGNGNAGSLPDCKEPGDLSSKTPLESSSESSSNPAKKAQQGHRWTTAFAFLRKTLHKSERKVSKDTPCTLGTISDKLPDTPHEGILHTGSHSHSSSPHKKLTFQIPEPAKQTHKNGTANGTTVKHPCHGHSRSNSGSFKKLSKRLPFRTLSKPKCKKNSTDVPQLSDTNQTAVMTNTVNNQTARDRSSSQNRQPERQSIPKMSKKQQTDQKSKCCLPLWDKLHKWWWGDSSIEGKEIRNTLVVGVAFQLIFTAHFAIQNLQSSLHEEEYLGVSALGCLYATSIFSSIFAPTIIGLLGLKGCLVLAWVTHMLYTLAQFYPTWQTLVPASVLLGALTGPTWTAMGVYVSACAFSFSRRSPHSPYTILSRFNGLFFTLYETRQMLGNLLSSVVLRHGVGNKSQEIIFKYCGPRDCPAAENVTDIEEPEALVIHSMLAIYTALQVVALLLTIVFLTPLSRSEWWSGTPIRETATSWFKTLVGTRMLLLVPFMVVQAMEQGMLLSEYTKSYISCPIGIHMVGFVMATHGATSAVFVFIFSRLARRTGRYPLFALAAVLTLALLIVLYDWTPREDQPALIFAFPVVWGIGEGIWQTQTNSMIAVMFWNRKESAFANYQTWRAVGFTFIFSFHSVLCVDLKIAITMGFLIVGMILYTAVEIHTYRKDRQSSNLPKEHAPAVSASHVYTVGSSSVELEERSNIPQESIDSEYDVGLPVSGVSQQHSSTMFRLFKFDDDSDLESGGHVTLDGTYLSRGESAFLDNDLKRYGVVPSSGIRPLTRAHLAKSSSEDSGRWEMKERDSARNSGSPGSSNQRLTRPHTWHEISAFEDEGELRVLRTKNDVLVY